MVKWSLRDSTGCKQRGEIELAQIPGELLRFEREAARIMKRTGADHYLLGKSGKSSRRKKSGRVGA